MYRRPLLFKMLILGAFGCILILSLASPALAAGSAPQQPEPDLEGVELTPTDLPSGTVPLSASDLARLQGALEIWETYLEDVTSARLINVTGFQNSDPLNRQFIISALLSPLSASEQVLFDQAFADPERMIDDLAQSVGQENITLLPGVGGIGESRLGFLLQDSGITMRYVVARRGSVLIEVAVASSSDSDPAFNCLAAARLLDDRVAAVVGAGAVAFRPVGPLVPELTTYIPAPQDLSTQPGVIGANLFLAALLMLPFAAAAELLTRTLSGQEGLLRRLFLPLDWVGNLPGRVRHFFESRLHLQPSAWGRLRVVAIILFYGLVFSLLDRTWNPFTLPGLVLFFSMTVAYGLVGIADDFFQYRSIRRWGLPAGLSVRPTNLLISILSTSFSRLVALVPGLMFGTPEALQVDEAQFTEKQRSSLLKTSALTFSGIGLAFWFPTLLTGLLQDLDLPSTLLNLLGGLEAFLLVVFAVAVENTFVQLLGFPGGFGQALKRRNRWLWLGVLLLVAFFFLHTLLNPRGDFRAALAEGDVILFIIVVVAFVLFTFGLRFYLARRKSPATALSAPAPLPSSPIVTSPLAAGPVPASVPFPAVLPAASAALPPGDAPSPEVTSPPLPAASALPPVSSPLLLPASGEKTCPSCGNVIKAQARLCRFCRATFTVVLRGYCLSDHAVVEVDEAGKCPRCGTEPADLHVESRLLQAPPPPQPTSPPAPLPSPAPPSPPAQGEALPPSEAGGPAPGTRVCPSCGQVVKAEARLCRFCRTSLEPLPSPSTMQPSTPPSPPVDSSQKCPRCHGSLAERPGSPVSPYINSYSCPGCGWRGLKCGDSSCDGCLRSQEIGYPNTVRYTCVRCGWTATGPRL